MGRLFYAFKNIDFITFSSLISLQMLHAWPLTTTMPLIKVTTKKSLVELSLLGRTGATADYFHHLPPNTDCILPVKCGQISLKISTLVQRPFGAICRFLMYY